jgi:hypothetical protein
VQNGIDAAIAAKCAGVIIPPGTYRLPKGPDRWHLQLNGTWNFTIYAVGVTFVLTDSVQGGIAFGNCKNVALVGGTFTHEKPPFTQGTIEAIAADGKSYDVRTHAGYYPLDDAVHIPAKPTGYIFDPGTRQWKSGVWDLYFTGFTKLAADRFRVNCSGTCGPPGWNVAVGDLMAFRGNGSQDIYVGGSSAMKIVGVTITHASGFVVHDDGGDGGNYYSYKLTYGPIPAGATEKPLITSNADGFHSSGTRKGPTIEWTQLEGMPDDGIPIHGGFCLVLASSTNKLTITANCGIRAGDTLRIYDAANDPAGTAAAQSIQQLTAYTPPAGTSRYNAFTTLTGRTFYEVTLDKTVPAAFDWLIANQNAIGSGYVVRNNVIRNHRARGMLLKANGGLVEGNTVDGSTMAGIVLAPEVWWAEADFSHDVTVRNNVIRHTGYTMISAGSEQCGALTISGEAKGAPGHARITVEGNTFENEDGINLLVNSADDVSVTNNRFVHAQYSTTDLGQSYLDHAPDALVWVSYSNNVRFSGNTVTQRGPLGTEIVHVDPTATAVTGAAAGFAVTP